MKKKYTSIPFNDLESITKDTVTTLKDTASSIKDYIYQYIEENYHYINIESITFSNKNKKPIIVELSNAIENKQYIITKKELDLILNNNSMIKEYYDIFLKLCCTNITNTYKIKDSTTNSNSEIRFWYNYKKNNWNTFNYESKMINYYKEKYKDDIIIEISNYNRFIKLKNTLIKYKQIKDKYNSKTKDIYTTNFFIRDTINPIYKSISLEKIDLKNINFDNKNISGINISQNPEVNINFDKIVKDLTNSNISGYNLNKYTFRGFNLTNCNLSNTHATIDLATCTINKESKIETGTIFDENNKFVFLNKSLTQDQVKNLGIKIHKKVI